MTNAPVAAVKNTKNAAVNNTENTKRGLTPFSI